MLAREALHAFAPWRPQRSDQASPETKAIIEGLRHDFVNILTNYLVP